VDNPLAAGIDQLVNNVSITDDGLNGPDPTPGDNSDTDTDSVNAAPELSVIKSTTTTTAGAGTTVVYSIVYANNGTQDATGVVIVEHLPPGTTYDAVNSDPGWVDIGGGDFEFAAGAMAAGESRTLAFALTVTDINATGGSLNNLVEINDDGTNGPDPDPTNDSFTVGTTVSTGLPGSIGGIVFVDENSDGVFSLGETPLEGVLVSLEGTSASGVPLMISTVTDVDGLYRFTNVPAGTYTILQQQPVQFLDGLESTSNPNAMVTGNDEITVTLGPGQDVDSNNFGESGIRIDFISKRSLLSSTPTGAYDNLVPLGLNSSDDGEAGTDPMIESAASSSPTLLSNVAANMTAESTVAHPLTRALGRLSRWGSLFNSDDDSRTNRNRLAG